MPGSTALLARRRSVEARTKPRPISGSDRGVRLGPFARGLVEPGTARIEKAVVAGCAFFGVFRWRQPRPETHSRSGRAPLSSASPESSIAASALLLVLWGRGTERPASHLSPAAACVECTIRRSPAAATTRSRRLPQPWRSTSRPRPFRASRAIVSGEVVAGLVEV
jgi:hypothetical protein